MSFFSKPKKQGHVKYKQELNNMKDLYDQIVVRLDKIDARQSAQEEIKHVLQSRIERLSENIGELKELFKVLSNDKKELEVSISKANASLERVQPEKIDNKMSRMNSNLDKIDGKVDLLDKKYNNLSKEVDKYTRKLKVFKGEDQLLKLQEKVKEDLKSIEATANLTNRHASKLENHYIKINEKVNSSVRAVKELNALKEELENLKFELESQLNNKQDSKVDERLEQLSHLTVDGLSRLKNKISEQSAEVELIKNDLKMLNSKELIKLIKESSSSPKK